MKVRLFPCENERLIEKRVLYWKPLLKLKQVYWVMIYNHQQSMKLCFFKCLRKTRTWKRAKWLKSLIHGIKTRKRCHYPYCHIRLLKRTFSLTDFLISNQPNPNLLRQRIPGSIAPGTYYYLSIFLATEQCNMYYSLKKYAPNINKTERRKN